MEGLASVAIHQRVRGGELLVSLHSTPENRANARRSASKHAITHNDANLANSQVKSSVFGRGDDSDIHKRRSRLHHTTTYE